MTFTGKAALIAACIALAALLLVFGVANFLVSFALDCKNPRGVPHEEIPEEEMARWRLLPASTQEVSVQGEDGTTLIALLLRPKDDEGAAGKGAHRYVISVHGYKSVPESMVGIVSHYIEAGWNVLAIEHRAHGKSPARYTSMGYYEKGDLLRWIGFIESIDRQAEILLHGVSMGAATVMLATGEELPPSVRAAVEDCGYSTLIEEFSTQLKQFFRLPSFPLIPAASLICKARIGFSFSAVDCLSAVARSSTPTLFIHGEEDEFVPFSMLDELYSAASCEKQRLAVPGAAHAESDETSPELYWGAVDAFVARYFSSSP